jgi:hypothetical protein
MAFGCLNLGDGLYETGGDLEIKLATDSGLEIIAGQGLSLSDDQKSPVWQTWTPTYSNLTVGNGTVLAQYQRNGDTITWRWKFTLGSTSAMGTNPTVSIPVAAHAGYSALSDYYGRANALDLGVAIYPGICEYNSSTNFILNTWNAASTYVGTTPYTATVPFTWATGDSVFASGVYQAA